MVVGTKCRADDHVQAYRPCAALKLRHAGSHLTLLRACVPSPSLRQTRRSQCCPAYYPMLIFTQIGMRKFFGATKEMQLNSQNHQVSGRIDRILRSTFTLLIFLIFLKILYHIFSIIESAVAIFNHLFPSLFSSKIIWTQTYHYPFLRLLSLSRSSNFQSLFVYVVAP